VIEDRARKRDVGLGMRAEGVMIPAAGVCIASSLCWYEATSALSGIFRVRLKMKYTASQGNYTDLL